MSKLSRTIMLFMLFIAFGATAQPRPTVHVDHDWTVNCGEAQFGVRQWYFTGAPRCQTTIYFGPWSFRVGMPAIPLIICGLAPLVIGGFLLMRFGQRTVAVASEPQQSLHQ